MNDPDLFAVFALADRLKIGVNEVMAMPEPLFIGWLAYIKILNDGATH